MRRQLSPSTHIITDSGRTLRVDSFIGEGGQAEVYRATLQGQSHPVALKLFHKSQATEQTKKRIKHLTKLKLDQLDPAICAPFDTVTKNGLVGHVAPFVGGESLLEALENASLSFGEAFEVALQILVLIIKITDAGIVHGDLQTQNFIIRRDINGIRLFMIDLDNFTAKGVPRPKMIGMTLYIAPELRKCIGMKRSIHPTRESDLYSLGVLLHEILLSFHPIAGFDQTVEEIEKSMSQEWKYDPGNLNAPKNPHGYPARSLSPELVELFRDALSQTPNKRPSIESWVPALENATKNLLICSECQVPYVSYISRTECPFGHRVNVSILRLENGAEIRVDGFTTILGRKELGGSNRISRQHLVVRKIRNSLCVESIGKNPTFIREGIVWRTLNQNEFTELKPNDRLLVADTPLWYTPK
ncbi:MAG: protein kinase [candidate division Zixibacteria bacterium]|nr:protein kinase [candidate division Zixibacteria bacterium]